MPDMNEHPILITAKMKNCDLLIADLPQFALPWKDQYESETYEGKCSEIITATPMDYFIDIGAAFGYYAALAHIHHPELRSVSIEANPLRAGCCKWSLMPIEHASVLDGYVGQPAPKRPTVPWGMVSHRDETPTMDLRSTHFNPSGWWNAFRINSKEAKCFVKMDVEGGELEVLERMSHMLGDKNVAWLIEVHREFVSDEQVLAYFPDREFWKFQDHGSYVKIYLPYAS